MPGTPWITREQSRAFLNMLGSVDDTELDGFIAASCALIERIVGAVTPTTVADEAHTVGSRSIVVLDVAPVVDVVSVVTVPGWGQIGGVPVTVDGVTPGGVLTVATWPKTRVSVTYHAGREPVPGDLTEAALELTAHHWRATQNQAGGRSGRPVVGGSADQMIVPGLSSALPYRVRELLGLWGKQVSTEALFA